MHQDKFRNKPANKEYKEGFDRIWSDYESHSVDVFLPLWVSEKKVADNVRHLITFRLEYMADGEPPIMTLSDVSLLDEEGSEVDLPESMCEGFEIWFTLHQEQILSKLDS